MAVDSVGPYRILEKLGAGAMGVVYLAQDTRLSRPVALKTFLKEQGREHAVRRLFEEARALAQVKHANIPAVYHVEESADTPYIVMEYVEGRTLDKRLQEGPLKVPEVIDFGVQLARGLAAAHAAGVIHRDLKPANVMVTEKGAIKILDFGLARSHAVETKEPSTGGSGSQERHVVAGTPGYIAPELLESQSGQQPHVRSDIYSLGVTLFELATGERPFPGHDRMAALTKPVRHITEVDPELPGDLDAVVARAMARQPEDRFATADDLAEALGAASALAAASTRSVLWKRPRGRRSELRRWWLPAGVLVVALPALALWRPWARPFESAVARPTATETAREPTVVAVLPLVGDPRDQEADHLAAGIRGTSSSARSAGYPASRWSRARPPCPTRAGSSRSPLSRRRSTPTWWWTA